MPECVCVSSVEDLAAVSSETVLLRVQGLTPAIAEALARLPSLGRIHLSIDHVDEAALAELGRLGALERIQLWFPRGIPSASWRTLASLPRLESITLVSLHGPKAEASLLALGELLSLRRIFVTNSGPITPAVLDAWCRLPRLAELQVDGCDVVPAAWDALAGARRLERLRVAYVGGAGLLEGVAGLESLGEASLQLLRWKSLSDDTLERLLRPARRTRFSIEIDDPPPAGGEQVPPPVESLADPSGALLPGAHPAGPDDVDGILRVDAAAFARGWPRRVWLVELLNDDTEVLLVRERTHGTPVGVVSFGLRHGAVHVRRLGVAPGWRRLGIGRRLMGRVLEVAAARRCPEVLIEVRRDDPGAMAFYHRLGFVAWNVDRDAYGEGQDAVDMVWDPGYALDALREAGPDALDSRSATRAASTTSGGGGGRGVGIKGASRVQGDAGPGIHAQASS